MNKSQNISEIFQHYRNRYMYWPEYEMPCHTDVPGVIVVIPAFHEDRLETTLESLEANVVSGEKIVVIVVLNYPHKLRDEWSAFHTDQYDALIRQKSRYQNFELMVIRAFDLPEKRTGVGAARKIGMDQALRIFANTVSDGVIMCLDGDCTVSVEYLKTCNRYSSDDGCNTLVIPFEHSLEDVSASLKEGILAYELHLRYYKNALKWTGFPYAFHTVGSSMGVRASVYGKLGGMNRRKAGEDFYFLNKCFAYGGVVEATGVKVFPSARVSDRVPFGTGRAQEEWLKNRRYENTYHIDCWRDLRLLLEAGDSVREQEQEMEIPDYFMPFLEKIQFRKNSMQIRNRSSSDKQYRKHFYQWFDGFMVMKFLNFLRDEVHGEMEVDKASGELVNIMGQNSRWHGTSMMELLTLFRRIDDLQLNKGHALS